MDVAVKFSELLCLLNIEEEVRTKFELLPDTPKKVKFIHGLLEGYNLVPQIEVRYPKDKFLSNLCREEANCLYRAKDFVGALVGYNRAICYAGAECISLGYANRSAAYFELKLYDECLDNVRLAREAGYPDHLLSKLEDREAKCLEAMRRKTVNDKPKYQPKLSYPANRENPGMADCIELATSEKYGRHFVAKQDLKVGDIVILEKPYHSNLLKTLIYERCTYCLSEKQLNLIPCPGCTKTMFCSHQCMESANKFHKTLCPIIDRIFEMPESFRDLALQVLLSAMQNFGSVDALVTTTKKKNYKNPEKVRQRKEFDAFYAMESTLDNLKFGDAILFALMYGWFINYTNLALQLSTVKKQDIFLDFWVRFFMICKLRCTTNHTELMRLTSNGKIVKIIIGQELMPLISLLNHSCAPNTMSMYVSGNESKAAAMIIRPVQKGEQLFISYNDFGHYKNPKFDRQQKLLKYYNFLCACEACTKNYPLMMALPQTRPPRKVTLEEKDEYLLMDHSRALRMFEDCKEYLQENDSNYPSLALLVAQLALDYTLKILCQNCALNVGWKKE